MEMPGSLSIRAGVGLMTTRMLVSGLFVDRTGFELLYAMVAVVANMSSSRTFFAGSDVTGFRCSLNPCTEYSMSFGGGFQSRLLPFSTVVHLGQSLVICIFVFPLVVCLGQSLVIRILVFSLGGQDECFGSSRDT